MALISPDLTDIFSHLQEHHDSSFDDSKRKTLGVVTAVNVDISVRNAKEYTISVPLAVHSSMLY